MNKSIIYLSILIFPLFSNVDYNTEIQPIFNENCINCHNVGSSNYDDHQLDLTSYYGLMLGGEDGAVVIPGNSNASELYDKIEDGEMPPGNNPDLSYTQINLIAQWIDEGALPEIEPVCDEEFIDFNGYCLYQDDISVLQEFIDNSVNSGMDNSPNPYMDDPTAWFSVEIDGEYNYFANGNGILEPLELGMQEWTNGRLTSWMCGSFIYCDLSGNIPGSINQLTALEVLRLEMNMLTGFIPESLCELELDYDDYLDFDLSWNYLCAPFPVCVEDSPYIYSQFESLDCYITGDVNFDGIINVLDIVTIVNMVLNNEYNTIADVNQDGHVNILDIVIMVNIIVGGLP